MKVEDFADGWKQITFFGYPADWIPVREGEIRVALDSGMASMYPTQKAKKFWHMRNLGLWTCPVCGAGQAAHKLTMQQHFDRDHN